MRHLLVTNDFPPKVGGIQSYLWELWRRLPAGDVTVLTCAHPQADRWDRRQPFRVVRTRRPVLLPTKGTRRLVERLAGEVDAGLVVLDPALPLGLIGPSLGRPYAVVLHGAEIAVPGRLPGSRNLMRSVLGPASLIIAAGSYPEAEGRRAVGKGTPFPPVVQVPPGVDLGRFRPLAAIDRAAARARFGLPASGRLVLSVSRLVPRKGMDTLIEASALMAPSRPDLHVAVAGAGRDRRRLEHLARRRRAPVSFLGRVDDAALPGLYGCADVFAMCCRNRWGGLEREGFGIVFLEAAACAVPAVAGDSGGAAEAVLDGRTGSVVTRPADPVAVATALGRLVDRPGESAAQGLAARARAEGEFDYDRLALRLARALDGVPRR